MPARRYTHAPIDALEPFAFHTTRWTRVCLAKVPSDDGRRALAELCEAYYEPVVAYLRCELRDTDMARELSHSFFEQLLGGGRIHMADPARGRFRSYLLGAAKHFLAHHRESVARAKRGGGQVAVPLDDAEATAVPDGNSLPDAVFERQWAMTVLARGLDALRAQCAAEGKAEFFEQMKPLLTGDMTHGAQADQNWQEIDAVELVGRDHTRQWASQAEASSYWGSGRTSFSSDLGVFGSSDAGPSSSLRSGDPVSGITPPPAAGPAILSRPGEGDTSATGSNPSLTPGLPSPAR